MEAKKIVIVFGTRPEAIKMAPVIKEFEKHKKNFELTVISTAQHREMLDQVLDVFNIEPDYDLDVMRPEQSLSDITADVLKRIEKIYIDVAPDMVLVHGDTTTSYAAALAAFYLQIPIGHVEAGLRTNDKYFPFPEEANRQMIDQLADLYFVPTFEAGQNLINENKDQEKIVVTGNTIIDTVQNTHQLQADHQILDLMEDQSKRWILLTMHRRENYGLPMENVFYAVNKIVEENKDVEVVMPMHLNPLVRQSIDKHIRHSDRVHLVEPLEVNIFHKVLGKSYLVLTDSGGLQEEAAAVNVPVLVLRNITERPEGEEAGTLKVIGTETEDVYEHTSSLLNDKQSYKQMSQAKNPFGDGKASERVIKNISKYFSNLR